MSTTAILPQAGVETFITAETEALQAELFCSIYGLDWRAAWRLAIAELPELLAYAAEWDRDAGPPIVFTLEAAHAAA